MQVSDTYFSNRFPLEFLAFPHSLTLQYLYLTLLPSIIQFSFAQLVSQFRYFLITAFLLIIFKSGYLVFQASTDVATRGNCRFGITQCFERRARGIKFGGQRAGQLTLGEVDIRKTVSY